MPNNFCIKPFKSVQVFSNGAVDVCCKIKPKLSKFVGNKEFNANKDLITDCFNSDYVTYLQQQFLQNKQPIECNKCWSDEKQGFQSLRLESNRNFKTTFSKKLNILEEVEVHVTNLCNLKCQMCSGESSSKLLVENNALGFEKLVQKDYEFSDFAWENIDSVLSEHTKLLTLLGGEPLMVPNIREILQKCIDKKIAKNIFLQIFTNGTLYNNEFKKILEKFKNVRLIFSVEGIGKYNEYIRYPSDWNIIDQNIEKFKQKNTELYINSIVQNLNILYIHKLVQWANKKKIFLKLEPLVTPPYLQYVNLPLDLLKIAYQNLLDASKTEDLTHTENFNTILNSLKNKIEKYTLNNTNWLLFKNMIKARDEYRKVSINDYLPELGKFL